MKQFLVSPDTASENFYACLYPTKTPRTTINPLRRIQGQREEDAARKGSGALIQRTVLRALPGHHQRYQHLYTERELKSVCNNYLNYVAPPIPDQLVLGLDEGEYRGVCEEMARFFQVSGDEHKDNPFHPFLTYFKDDIAPSTAVVLSPIAHRRTVEDVELVSQDGRESELLEFLAEQDPEKKLDEVYLALREVALNAAALSGGLAVVMETPGS